MKSDMLRQIYAGNDPFQAQRIKEALEAEGIPCQVDGLTLQDALGALPVASMRIMVLAEHEQAAQKIVSDLESSRTAQPQPDWSCPKCGELNAGSFDLCWNCEADRPQ